MVVVTTVVILLWICTHVDRNAGRTMATKRKLTTKTYQEKYDIIKFCEANPMMKKTAIAEKSTSNGRH